MKRKYSERHTAKKKNMPLLRQLCSMRDSYARKATARNKYDENNQKDGAFANFVGL
jgi:hypothetical protein